MRKKSRKLSTALSIGLVLGLLTVFAALAASVLVDDFSPGGPSLTLTFPGSGQDFGFATSSGLGDERDVIVTGSATTSGDQLRVRVIDENGTSKLSFTADSSVTGQATIQWDGVDGSADLDTSGLNNADLTGGGTNDGFHIEVLLDDVQARIVMQVHNGGTSASSLVELPGGITPGGHVDFFIPFDSFQPAGFDFTNVGAVVMVIDGTVVPGLDLELDLVEVDGFRDYGDLPDTYGNAAHIPTNGARFGNNLDIEEEPQYSTNATGDDVHQIDDEDGIIPTAGFNWSPGPDGGSLDFNIRGCRAGCYLSGWIDWNDNEAFDAGEQILGNIRVTSGVQPITFDIPDATVIADQSFLGRFRLCTATGVCDEPAGEVTGGEVEDHLFSFGPTAVTLTSLSAKSSLSTAATLAIAALTFVVLMVAAVAVELRRQRRLRQ